MGDFTEFIWLVKFDSLIISPFRALCIKSINILYLFLFLAVFQVWLANCHFLASNEHNHTYVSTNAQKEYIVLKMSQVKVLWYIAIDIEDNHQHTDHDQHYLHPLAQHKLSHQLLVTTKDQERDNGKRQLNSLDYIKFLIDYFRIRETDD